jgi:glycosyltransferase 2 family protein
VSTYSAWVARLLVSAITLGVLLVLVPFGQLTAAVSAVPPPLWGAAVLLFLAGHGVAAFKWQLLLRHGGRIPTRAWLRAHFAGLAANLCLPGVAGGDVVRAECLRRSFGHGEQIAVAAVVDRALDCLALLVLAAAGMLMTGGSEASRRVILMVGAAGLAAALAGAVLGLVVFKASGRRSGLVGRLGIAARQLAARPALPLVCLLLSLGVQTMFVIINMRFGLAVGVAVPLAGWLVAWPLAKLVALVPISLAGLGIREAALVAFLQPYGASAAPVTAAGLLWQSVLFAGGLAGWLTGAVVTTQTPTRDTGEPVEL